MGLRANAPSRAVYEPYQPSVLLELANETLRWFGAQTSDVVLKCWVRVGYSGVGYGV